MPGVLYLADGRDDQVEARFPSSREVGSMAVNDKPISAHRPSS
jgi:hypothetical protein